MLTTSNVPPVGQAAPARALQPSPDTATPAQSSADSKAQEPGTAKAAQAAPAAASAPAASPLKLVVAKAEASMAFTYTLVDQTTGRVIAEIPHQAAQDAAANPNYVAGGVVDTTA